MTGPTKYYLKAKEAKYAALVQGKVFLDWNSPWEWLSTVTSRADAKDFFTVEPIEEVYYPCKNLIGVI